MYVFTLTLGRRVQYPSHVSVAFSVFERLLCLCVFVHVSVLCMCLTVCVGESGCEADPETPCVPSQDDERRLLRYMFVLLRSGQMAKAQELCLRVGQPWRAAALEGWKLAHDTNYEEPASERQPLQGNPLR